MSGSQTQVFAGSVSISADELDHCTIAPMRYLVTLVVHVIVTGAVFLCTSAMDKAFSEIILLCSDCILFLVKLIES